MSGPAYIIKTHLDIFNLDVFFMVGEVDDCYAALPKEDKKKCEQCGPFVETLKKVKANVEEKKRPLTCDAFTVLVPPFIVIYAQKTITQEILVHEISHVVDIVFTISGCSEGELRATLCGYIFKHIMNGVKDFSEPLNVIGGIS